MVCSPAPTCTVTFDQNPLTGSVTTMHWSSTNTDLFYINNVGYVGASGSAQISQTGDYSGTVSGAGGIAACSATLSGPGSSGGSCTNGSGNGSQTSSQSSTPTVIYLTSGTSWTVPSDWNSSNNTIEVIGGGGSGYVGVWLPPWLYQGGSGGGGGAYSKIANASLTPGATVSYSVGGPGGDTFFNGSTYAGASVAAKGGESAAAGSYHVPYAGAGGQASAGIGTVKYSGGSGGPGGTTNQNTSGALGGGGGGAAGSHGDGIAGVSGDGGGNSSGGTGDSGFGGTAGQPGTEWGSYGSGGGGNGGSYSTDGLAGGVYGAGGGGSGVADYGGVVGNGAPGAQGIIVVTYYPQTGSTTSGSGSTSGSSGTNNCTNSCTPTSQTCQPSGNLLNNCGQTTTCQFGCSTVTNQCKTSNTCVPFNVCNTSGTKVVNVCGGATVDDCSTRGAGWMCVEGACRISAVGFQPFDGTLNTGQTFSASGHLQVTPSLVRQGGSTRVYWNVMNAADCTVTGDNGDGILGSSTGIWNTLSSGGPGKTTSLITGKTTYTLLCHAFGATPASVSETATVNIVPSFQEQ